MTYEGDFILSKQDGVEKKLRHGKGVLRWQDGREYRGQFALGSFHGEGIFLWPNGDSYVGQYCDGYRDGIGKFKFADGSAFEGNWCRGKPKADFGCTFRPEYRLDESLGVESNWNLNSGVTQSGTPVKASIDSGNKQILPSVQDSPKDLRGYYITAPEAAPVDVVSGEIADLPGVPEAASADLVSAEIGTLPAQEAAPVDVVSAEIGNISAPEAAPADLVPAETGALAAPEAAPVDVVSAEITIDAEYETISQDLPAFQSQFVKGLSDALGIDEAQIQVTDVRRGSIVVEFAILGTTGIPAKELIGELSTQLAAPESRLKTGVFGVFAQCASVTKVSTSLSDAPARIEEPQLETAEAKKQRRSSSKNLPFLSPGSRVRLLKDKDAVIQACQKVGITSSNDDIRRKTAGKFVQIVFRDTDGTVKAKVTGVGDLWFGIDAFVKPEGEVSAGEEAAIEAQPAEEVAFIKPEEQAQAAEEAVIEAQPTEEVAVVKPEEQDLVQAAEEAVIEAQPTEEVAVVKPEGDVQAGEQAVIEVQAAEEAVIEAQPIEEVAVVQPEGEVQAGQEAVIEAQVTEEPPVQETQNTVIQADSAPLAQEQIQEIPLQVIHQEGEETEHSPEDAYHLKEGGRARLIKDPGAIIRACRKVGITSSNDHIRQNAAGKQVMIVMIDTDNTVKVKLRGVGDLWFGVDAFVRPDGSEAQVGEEATGLPGTIQVQNYIEETAIQSKVAVINHADGHAVIDGKKLPLHKVAEFKEIFLLFDTDGSGTITAEELGTVMRSLGQYPSDADCREKVASLDKDNSGAINFDEFLQLMVAQMRTEEKEGQKLDFVEAFEVFDKDGNGYVDAKELRHMMQNHGAMRLTDDEVDEMMRDADVNADGKLNFEEFVALMMAPIEDGTRVEDVSAAGDAAIEDIG